MTIPGYTEEKGCTPSYGYDVLDDLANTLGGIVIQHEENGAPATPEAATVLANIY